MDAGRDGIRQGAGGQVANPLAIDSGKIGPCHPILQFSWGLGAGCKCLVAFRCQARIWHGSEGYSRRRFCNVLVPRLRAIPSGFGMA